MTKYFSISRRDFTPFPAIVQSYSFGAGQFIWDLRSRTVKTLLSACGGIEGVWEGRVVPSPCSCPACFPHRLRGGRGGKGCGGIKGGEHSTA